MDELSMSRTLMRLNLALKRALDSTSGNNGWDIRDKLLFLISEGVTTPLDIMPRLCINKCNLALICTELEKKGYIEKSRNNLDKRELIVSLTMAGEEYLNDKLKQMENACQKAYAKKDYPETLDTLNAAKGVLELL